VRRLIATLALAAALLVASAAAASNPANQAALDRTVRYQQGAQQRSGGYGAAGEPSQVVSAWTALALAAAGVNPQDQRRPGGTDAFSYLASRYPQAIAESECAPIACTTTLERLLMVVNASGTNPHDFGGVDLVAELLARARSDGSFPHVPGGLAGVNDTIFAVFALAPIQEPAAQAAIQPAADWIESAQHASGGWSWSVDSTLSEVDMTGAAIQALVAAGRAGGEAVRRGLAFLRAAQNPDGGFPGIPGASEANVASTAWAVQAIWAVGENPEGWRTGSGLQTEEPLDYMESLQEPDGHIRWKRSRDLNGVWMTAYTTPAFSGHHWPIPAPPRSISPPAPPEAGEGEGNQSGKGVIAGGGGGGAPLFSRPRPQSKGKTPGGARTIGNEGVRVVNHSETRRGPNARQSDVTQIREATESAARSGGGASGSSTAGGGRASGAGREVSGTVIGSVGSTRPGKLAFGAPGLHGAGVDRDGEGLVAAGIGALSLLLALGGAGWERRRQGVIA
jgi:Squalene-hopene cyclase C-terminal domain